MIMSKEFNLYKKGNYTIKAVVCDYGIYECDELLTIVNSLENGKLIVDILDEDMKHNTWNI